MVWKSLVNSGTTEPKGSSKSNATTQDQAESNSGSKSQAKLNANSIRADARNPAIQSSSFLTPYGNSRSTLFVPEGTSRNTRNPLRVPNSGGSGGSSMSFPAPNSIQRSGNSRHKVRLEPGHSPLDWAQLKSSGKNLRDIPPQDFPMKVTKEELSKHKSKEDCWTSINGKVYNITPYLKFHPGGVPQLMRCAGIDGTQLFNKYHAWVNAERMLDGCLVGFYVR